MLYKKDINRFLKYFHLELNGLGYMQSLRKYSTFPDPFKFQAENIHTAKVIFDIGANRGDTVQKYCEIFPNSQIYAFEPFPEIFKLLIERFKSFSSVHCLPFAISDKESIVPFYTNFNSDTNSLLKSKKIGLNSDKQTSNLGSISLKTTSIDLYCKENGISEISILKLDIQGGELQALEGAINLLKTKSIKLIYTEAYFRHQYEDQPLFHDISKFLSQFGYFLQDVYNPIYGNGSIVWCDAIFLPIDE
jgi:FkbM family methyltransferase